MRVAFFGIAGATPAATSANVSFVVHALIDRTPARVLVDCSGTPATDLASLGVDLKTLDAVVLTHAHTDHLYALPSLFHSALMMNRRRPLVIAGNSSTLDRAERLLDLFGLLDRKNGFPVAWHDIEDTGLHVPHIARARESVLCITAHEVEHSIPTVALRFEHGHSRLAYSCDTRPCDAVTRTAEGATVLIHEASGPQSAEAQLNEAGHSSARQAGRAARTASAAELFLVHLPPAALDVNGGCSAYVDEARSEFGGVVHVPELKKWHAVPER